MDVTDGHDGSIGRGPVKRVGFIGLGNQGAPMAVRIAAEGFELVVWARRVASTEAVRGLAEIVDEPATLARRVDVVCVCVRSDEDLLEVCTGRSGLVAKLRPGSVLVVHSTVAPKTVLAVAREATRRSVAVLDAPVSGGAPAAAAGHLLTIVGGDESVLEDCRTVLASHSDRIVHVGDVGSGQIGKLLNNGLFAANVALAHSALAAGAQLGLDRHRLGEVLASGSGQSFAGDRVIDADGADIRTRIRDLMAKDVGLLRDLLDSVDDGRNLRTAAQWVL